MDISEIIRTRRSIRRFIQKTIKRNILIELVDNARCAPSAANRQPLEYIIIDEAKVMSRLFEELSWAGYVKPKRNPPPFGRPVAYIVVLINKKRVLGDYGKADAAAAIESIILAAWSKGIGSCWLGSFKQENIREIFEIPEGYEIDSIIALGYPGEKPVMEEVKDSNNEEAVKYYLDEKDVLHVPKRKLENISHLNMYGRPFV